MATNTERTVYIIELKDKFTKGVSGAEKSTKRFNDSVDKAKKKTEGLESAFKKMGIMGKLSLAGVVAGAGTLLSKMGSLAMKTITVAKNFESTRVAFGALTQDVKTGNKLFEWAVEFSRKNVVTLQQTTTSIRKLLAYGIPEGDMRKTTKVLSEISAAVGTDRLPYLTLALGQVYSAGRLYGTELRQFREHGVDIISELAKGMNIGTAEVRTKMEKGLIGYDEVFRALEALTQPGGRFFGYLETAANTLEGSFGILQSTMTVLADEIGKNIVPELTKGVKSLTESMTSFIEDIDADKLKQATSQISTIVGELIKFAKIPLGTAKDVGELAAGYGALGLNLGQYIGGQQGSLWGLGRGMLEGKIVSSMGPVGMLLKTGILREGVSGLNDFFTQRPRTPFQRPTDNVKLDAGWSEKYVPEWWMDYSRFGKKDKKGGAKTTRSGRAYGTGSRDIIINIGELLSVEQQNINTNQDYEQVKEALTKTLITVVNDVSLTAQP